MTVQLDSNEDKESWEEANSIDGELYLVKGGYIIINE